MLKAMKKPATAIPPFSTTAQLSERWGRSVRHIIDLIEAGELEGAYKVDPTKRTSQWLIPTAAVDAYEQKKRAQPVKG